MQRPLNGARKHKSTREMVNPGDHITTTISVEAVFQGSVLRTTLDRLIVRDTLFSFFVHPYRRRCDRKSKSLGRVFGVLSRNGYDVVSVSDANIRSLKRYCERLNLPQALLSDPCNGVAQTFGIIDSEQRPSHATTRTAFVVERGGTVKQVIKKIKTATCGAQIVRALGLQCNSLGT